MNPEADPTLPLGQQSEYPESYDPELLFPIERAPLRETLLAHRAVPADVGSRAGAASAFPGVDLWNAYEVSWLNPNGLPENFAAQLRVPASSPSIVESKSLKLYLNSLNQHRFANQAEATTTIIRDLNAALGLSNTDSARENPDTSVQLRLYSHAEFAQAGFAEHAGLTAVPQILEEQDFAREVALTEFRCNPELLCPSTPNTTNTAGGASSSEVQSYGTHLFKSNCPVTGQPDWASVFVEIAPDHAAADSAGPIDPASLLTYLVSYRGEQDFHEHCVERIYTDILTRLSPRELTVYACFLRRGGIDINPYRSNCRPAPDFLRSARQ